MHISCQKWSQTKGNIGQHQHWWISVIIGNIAMLFQHQKGWCLVFHYFVYLSGHSYWFWWWLPCVREISWTRIEKSGKRNSLTSPSRMFQAPSSGRYSIWPSLHFGGILLQTSSKNMSEFQLILKFLICLFYYYLLDKIILKHYRQLF